MKRLLQQALVSGVTLLVVLHAAAKPAAAQSDDEIKAVLQELKSSADEFVKLIEPLTEEQWNFKPQQFRHTIGHEAEHIALAENDLQRIVQQALEADSDPVSANALAGKEEKVKNLMLHPERRAETYKVPGRLNSKPEVQEFFGRAHRNLIQLLESSSELKTHIYKHPNSAYDELTALQWFYYIAYHKRRHSEQIRGIMALPEFPSGSASADD